jgi:hypothetical protein
MSTGLARYEALETRIALKFRIQIEGAAMHPAAAI